MQFSKACRDVFGIGDEHVAIRYRKQYGTWQVYWNNPYTGKRESKSFADQKEAEKENSLIIHRLKYEPESFKPLEEPPEVEAKTLEQVYLEYLLEKQFSKIDLAKHRSNFAGILLALGNRPIAELTEADVEVVKQRIINTNTAATANNRLRIFRTVLYYAMDKGYLARFKFPQIPAPHYQRLVPPTQEEVAAIYAAAPMHIKRVIILGAYFGVRVGPCELFQLTWEDVDLQQRLLRIHGSKKNSNAPWRDVPIKERLVEIFRQWQAEDLALGAQHLVNYNGQPIKSIKRSWSTTLKRAGITRRIRPYDLRHAFGTELVAAGADIGTVARLMGHSSPTMLLNHYQFVMDKQKIGAIESLPDVP